MRAPGKSEGAGAAIAERLQPDPYYDLYRHFRTLSLFGTARQHDSDCVVLEHKARTGNLADLLPKERLSLIRYSLR